MGRQKRRPRSASVAACRGKRRYATGSQARRAIANIRRYGARGDADKKPAGAYPCPHCGGWHLTSRSDTDTG